MGDCLCYSKVIALGAFGGRIDQTIASIHVLYKMNSLFSEKCRENEIILMDENSLMLYLEAGENIIKRSKKYESTKGVGLIPLGDKVEKIQTQGLKYNMGNSEDPISSLDFKDRISTSNEIVDELVKITISDPVLFSTTINSAEF